MDKLISAAIQMPRQTHIAIPKYTFLQLAKDWKYHGFRQGIDFEFDPKDNVDQEAFINSTIYMLKYHTVEDAEGFFCALLKRAVVAGAAIYTIDGK